MLVKKLLPLLKKIKDILRLIYAQMILVFIAFAVMVLVTYIYVSKNERQHLNQVSQDVLSYAQASILSEILEPVATISTIAETIRLMILQGNNFAEVSKYMTSLTGHMMGSNDVLSYASGVYGFFDVFGGRFASGTGGVQPNDIPFEDLPWYRTAVEAEGKVGITEPVETAPTVIAPITYVRRIFDDDGNPLGIICLDIELDRIRQYAINIRVSKGSRGMLLNKQLMVIAHENPNYVGRSLRDLNDGISIENDLRQGREVSERRSFDEQGDSTIIFIRQLKNGWYLGLETKESTYYQSVKNIATLLSVIGILLAMVLNITLIRIAVAKNKADAESKQKSNFLATVSHEIRTPLNAILGIAEIQMHNKTIPQDTTEALNKIHNSGYSLLGIINDILDLSKIEAGKLELTPIKYDVASLIHDTAQLNMMRIGGKPIKFELQVNPSVPSELYGDELRVKQILNNLLSNAFKYTNSGEVVLSISSKYEDRVKNPYVSLIFKVSDTGQGMTQEQIRKLFDEYSRFNMDANRTTEGIGLGMNITRRLVTMMNGGISVESEVGKGTTFTVFVSQKNVGAVPMGKEVSENLRQFRAGSTSQMKSAQMVRDPMPYGSVLIVDDVETNLYVAEGLMSPYDLLIDTADSGFAAIDKIKAGNVYDIVFMDHMMPEMDGVETTRIMRGLGYTHPIVALTANAVRGQAEFFLANGFDEFISKPIDVRRLNTLLNQFIRDKQSPDVIDAAQRSAPYIPPAAADDIQEAAVSVSPDLARIFVRDAKKAEKALETVYEKREHFGNDDYQLYIINTHAIKGALGNIGETDLFEFAQKLETAGREKDITMISAETPNFLEKLKGIIEKHIPKEEDDNRIIEEDIPFLQEKLVVFRAACVMYDKKSAKEVIATLREKEWARQTRELLNNLSELLLHSDFEEAANTAMDYEQNMGSS
jgi:signal transduction histidine kinase/DNA-binding response OmpR family regulator/HPt (histidine-containing phosphotransfer) domain-containing protein